VEHQLHHMMDQILLPTPTMKVLARLL
jgi:hypothetical protein